MDQLKPPDVPPPPSSPPLSPAPPVPPHLPPADATTVVVPGPRARPRRWPIAAGVGAIAVLVAGGALALTGGDDGPSYSLPAAVDAAQDATGYQFEIEITAMGQTVEGAGAADIDDDALEMSMELGAMSMDAVYDLDGGVMYLGAALFEGFGAPIPDGVEWISVDAGELSEQLGVDFGASLSEDLGSFDDQLSLLEGADAEELGVQTLDELGGVEAKHYRVTRTIDDPNVRERLEELFADRGVDPPTSFTMEVWVDGSNHVRQLQSDLGVGEVIMRFTWDGDVQVEIPSEAVPFTEVFGQLG